MGAPAERPEWGAAVDLGDAWEWRRGRLWHKRVVLRQVAEVDSPFRRWFVSLVYADQNRSRAVRATLSRLLKEHRSGLILNVGAGATAFPGAINLDLHDGPDIHIIGADERLPFRNATVDLVILQEVLEHIAKPRELLKEIARVLRSNGRLYCQVPFQIGFHPGPCDYWRFSRQGLEELFRGPEWCIEELGTSLGHGSGFYRVAVEFVAVTLSCVAAKLYIPGKAAAAVGFYPLKAFDAVTRFSRESDRIPAGYFCVLRRTEAPGVVAFTPS